MVDNHQINQLIILNYIYTHTLTATNFELIYKQKKNLLR